MESTQPDEVLLELYRVGNWRDILEKCQVNKYLPWIWPSEENLNFIGKFVREQNAVELVSVGCGSGFLEWLISMATGIHTVGIELDKSWWTSKYATHHFIPLVFTEDSKAGHSLATSKDAVLLFCYFNNQPAFLDYIANYRGNCFIVIGPGEGRHTHTCPEPFHLPADLNASWSLSNYQEIRSSKDYIAIYTRLKLL